MKPEFDTTPYFRSHRKEPRGYGGWVFGPEPNADVTRCLFAPSGTYAQAKKWAMEQVPDALVFYVMP